MGKLAVISEDTVRKIVTRQLAFDAVKDAFEAVAADRSQVFDVVIGTGLNSGEAFACSLPDYCYFACPIV